MRGIALIGAVLIVTGVVAAAWRVCWDSSAQAHATDRVDADVFVPVVAPLESAVAPVVLADPTPAESSARVPVAKRSSRNSRSAKPAPAAPSESRLRVRVVEHGTGAAIAGGVLKWAAVRDDGRPGLERNFAPDPAEPGAHVVGCDPGHGEVQFDGLCTPFESTRAPSRVFHGDNELTLIVRRATAGRLTLLRAADDRAEISCPEIIQVYGELRADEICVKSNPPTQFVFKVPVPGAYRIRWRRAPDGYAMPEEQIVRFEPASQTEVSVRLTRTK